MSQTSITRVRQSHRTALGVIAVCGVILAGYVVIWLGVDRLHIGRADFTSTYVGATLLREGHRGDLYDDSVQRTLHSQLIAPDTEGNLPFVNPPTAAALAMPLSFLDLDTAWRVMGVLQVLCLGVGLWVVARPPAPRGRNRPAAVLAGLAGLPTLALLLLGQWDGVLVLGIALAWRQLRRQQDLSAGLLLAVSAGLAKPHVFIGIAVFLLAWRQPRVLLGAVLGALALGLIDVALVGLDGMRGLVAADSDDSSLWPLASLLGSNGLTGSWLGEGQAAVISGWVIAILALVGCAVLGDRRRRDGNIPDLFLGPALCMSLVGSPHLLAHDLTIAAVAFVGVIVSSQGDRQIQVWAAGLWLSLNAALVLDLGHTGTGPPGRLVPLVLLGAGAVAVHRMALPRGSAPAA